MTVLITTIITILMKSFQFYIFVFKISIALCGFNCVLKLTALTVLVHTFLNPDQNMSQTSEHRDQDQTKTLFITGKQRQNGSDALILYLRINSIFKEVLSFEFAYFFEFCRKIETVKSRTYS